MNKDEVISDIYSDLKELYEQATGKKQDIIFAIMSKILKLKVM